MGRSPSRSYWSGMRLLQLRQVKCHPFIPLKSLSLVVFSSSTISEPDSRNTREGRARVDPHFFSGGRGECQPASSAPSPAPISPAGISSRCASGFTLTSRGTLARSLALHRRDGFLANFNRSCPIRGGRRTRRTANAPENVGNLRPSGIGNTLPIQERLTVRTSARPTDRIIGKRERGGVKTTGRGRHAIPSWTKIYMFVGAEN